MDRDIRKTEKSSLLNMSSFREKLNSKRSKKISWQMDKKPTINKDKKVIKPRKISISNKNKSLQRRPIRL